MEGKAADAAADGGMEGEDDVEDDAAAAAEALMLSVQKGFAKAKAAGVPAATRLMKELRLVRLH